MSILQLEMEKTGMSEALLTDVRFHRLLLAYDTDLARRARTGRCARCGGVLHSARYRRKPRGLPAGLGEEYRQRFSFCCAARECRRRKTVTSLRFLGPKVYAAAIVVLVSALTHGATPATRRRLQGMVAASRRTVRRWHRWWYETFQSTPFWQGARASFDTPVSTDALPASLLERFLGDPATQLLATLRFLGPLTGGAAVLAM
jgi:hypothetical protein